MNRTLSTLPLAAALLLATAAGHAQTDTPPTPLEKQIHRLDLGIQGVGMFNTTVTGPVYPVASNTGQTLTQYGSNTFGALVTLRYIARPYVGFELNYGQGRYTENYTGNAAVVATASSDFQVQTQAAEYSIGYVITPPHKLFGLQPYAALGSGAIAFRPTPHGGEGEPHKARQVYYYNVGVQQEYFSSHFGLRAGFRQDVFLDPDFGQNYLTIKKHASTYEPMVGFYLRY